MAKCAMGRAERSETQRAAFSKNSLQKHKIYKSACLFIVDRHSICSSTLIRRKCWPHSVWAARKFFVIVAFYRRFRQPQAAYSEDSGDDTKTSDNLMI